MVDLDGRYLKHIAKAECWVKPLFTRNIDHDGTDLVNKKTRSSLKFGGCNRIKGTLENLVSAAKRDERIIYYALGPSHEFIDFLYRIGANFYAFQVINAAKHTCNPEQLSKFAEEVGVLPSKLFLHLLTYDTTYDNFVLSPKHLLNNLPVKNLTINLICVPKPDDKPKGDMWMYE